MKRIVSVVVAVLLLVTMTVTGIGIPVAQAGELVSGSPATSERERSVEKEGDVEPEYAGVIIRAILMGASRLWAQNWFRSIVVSAVRTFSNSRAANAVSRAWAPLGLTIENLIGTPTLTWTVVRDAFFRSLVNSGASPSTATRAALGLQEALKWINDNFPWFK